jgi:hypothetical protein
MTVVGWALLRQEGLGNPPYSLLATVLGLALLSIGSSVRQWAVRRKNGEHAPSARRLWYIGIFVGGPALIAATQAVGYYAVLPTREATWPWFSATFGPWAGEWESLAWAIAELCAVCLVTTLALFLVGRYAGAVGLVKPLDGYFLANPVSTAAGLILFAAVEPAVRTDFEHWTGTTWLTRVFFVVPIYAWVFHVGATRGGRTRG